MGAVTSRSGRQALISQRLNAQGSVSVVELSRELETSEVTIRKDSAAMED